MEDWLQSYARLRQRLDQFFERTGIQAHTVEPGTEFDPATMEPQRTVVNPDLKDEQVAAVTRRGLSFRGEPVRPMIVDVV